MRGITQPLLPYPEDDEKFYESAALIDLRKDKEIIVADSELQDIKIFRKRVQSGNRRLNYFFALICVGLCIALGGTGVGVYLALIFLFNIPKTDYSVEDWYNQPQSAIDNSTCALAEPEAGCLIGEPVQVNSSVCLDLLEDICQNCVFDSNDFQSVPEYCEKQQIIKNALFGIGLSTIIASLCCLVILAGKGYGKCNENSKKVDLDILNSQEFKDVQRKLGKNSSVPITEIHASNYEKTINFFSELAKILTEISHLRLSPFNIPGLANIILDYLDPDAYEIDLISNKKMNPERRKFFIEDEGDSLGYVVFEDSKAIRNTILKSQLGEFILNVSKMSQLREFLPFIPAILKITATLQHTYPEEKRVKMSAGLNNGKLVYYFYKEKPAATPKIINEELVLSLN